MGRKLTKLIEEATDAADTVLGYYKRVIANRDKMVEIKKDFERIQEQKSKGKLGKMLQEAIEDQHREWVKCQDELYKDVRELKSANEELSTKVQKLHAHVLKREEKNKWLKKESTAEARELVQNLHALYKRMYKKTKDWTGMGG